MVANSGSLASVTEYAPQASTYGLQGTIDPAASGVSLNEPAGMALDSAGNLWVADPTSPGTIVEYSKGQSENVDCPNPSTCSPGSAALTPVGSIADDGSGSLDDPAALAFDSLGDLWVVNAGNATVVEYTASQLSGLTSSPSPTPTVTLGWSGFSAESATPSGVAFDSNGDLWVADKEPGSLFEFKASTLSACSTQSQPCSSPADVTIAGASLSNPFLDHLRRGGGPVGGQLGLPGRWLLHRGQLHSRIPPRHLTPLRPRRSRSTSAWTHFPRECAPCPRESSASPPWAPAP